MPGSAMSPIMLRRVFFLSFLPPTTAASIEKCCSGRVGLHLSFLPAVFGLIRSFPRRAMQVSRAFYHWPGHSVRVNVLKKSGCTLRRLRQPNDRPQFLNYDVWRTDLELLGARSKRLVFSGVIRWAINVSPQSNEPFNSPAIPNGNPGNNWPDEWRDCRVSLAILSMSSRTD